MRHKFQISKTTHVRMKPKTYKKELNTLKGVSLFVESKSVEVVSVKTLSIRKRTTQYLGILLERL